MAEARKQKYFRRYSLLAKIKIKLSVLIYKIFKL